MAASTLTTTGMIDPTKQAEYPIILGDRLAGKIDDTRSQLININYNYKTKAATAQQRSVITRSAQSRDHYNLTITDKAPNAEQSVLTYAYQGSVDPNQSVSESEDHNLVLVFDSNKKVFVLEPVASQLNFNLRSAPAKTQKQARQQYAQLRTLHEDDPTSGDDRVSDHASASYDGPADDDNPTQTNPLRQKNPTTDPSRQKNTAKAQPKAKPSTDLSEKQGGRKTTERRERYDEGADEIVFESYKSSPSETGTGAVSSQKTVPSPGSNIIIDGDLIIDMGSPPPTRPAFKVNPAHFSSNNTPANGDEDEDEDEDEDIEALRLPSPVPTTQRPGPSSTVQGDVNELEEEEEEEEDDDDALAAEMEAAFEESVREEEARSQQSMPPISSHHYVPSDDESEGELHFSSLMASSRSHPHSSKRPVPAPSNPVLLAAQAQWLFTDEELTRAPSQLDGLKIEQENVNRSKGVNFITQVGIMLKLPQLTLATAAVYLHRFFMRYSMVDLPQRPGMHPYPIAATALFLATKVEENVRRMRELVVACCRVAQKQPNLVVDEQSKEFWKWRDTILHHEDLLLEALCFDLQLEQPYRILYDFICFFGVNESKPLRNAAWAFVNDSMFTVLCLQFPARTIAAAALYAAARHCDIGFEDDGQGQPWWEQIEVDLVQVRQACTRMAQLYESNAAHKHSQYYPTTPFLWDEGAEKTRIPHTGSSLDAPDSSLGRKRSREPEDEAQERRCHSQDVSPKSGDHLAPTSSQNGGLRSPKRPRVGSDATEKSHSATASFTSPSSTLPPGGQQPPPPPPFSSSSASSFSHDRPSNGHVPSQHHHHRYQHPLPPNPRSLPSRRNSESQSVDPIQQRIDEIVQQNMSPPQGSTASGAASKSDKRYREPDDVTRKRRTSSSAFSVSSAGGRNEHLHPPPPPPPSSSCPPEKQNRPLPPPPPSNPPEPDDDAGGSEEGEL
ncbi:hypothetical protein ARAM_001784 [Aspergillus rambellii]|uniref:RNA polymerase II holoenzyme cyclin-like subunit n=1 Tax=Aspergillus rambellii TaxID=308745 RepID=A0A0F8U9A4_9EURO|nr:hypothetical protein ARAM_001784 [Aspergillus rambellii]